MAPTSGHKLSGMSGLQLQLHMESGIAGEATIAANVAAAAAAIAAAYVAGIADIQRHISTGLSERDACDKQLSAAHYQLYIHLQALSSLSSAGESTRLYNTQQRLFLRCLICC